MSRICPLCNKKIKEGESWSHPININTDCHLDCAIQEPVINDDEENGEETN